MSDSSAMEIDAGALAFADHAPPKPRGVTWGERSALVAALVVYVAVLAAAAWAVMKVLPDELSATLAGHTVHVGNLRHRLFSNAVLVFLLLPGALWVEFMTVGWVRSSVRKFLLARSPSVKTDMAVFVLGQAHLLDILGKVMLVGLSMVSGLWIRNWLTATTGLAINPPDLPVPVLVVAYFFVYTFFDYWTHRLDHSPFFWPLHRYHHSAEEFCVITAGRVHPAAFTPIFLINIPMAILGAPADVMLYVNVVVIAVGFLIHSEIGSDWGWFGRWVIQSPVSHRLHHKLDMSYPTGNFAMAPIWDRLFGTFNAKADPTLAIGVERAYRHGWWFLADVFRDYWHFWKGVFTRRPIE